LLTVARAGALNGKFPVVGAAAAEALRGAPSDSADEARGKLYEGAARILTADYDAGVAELQSVAASKLDRRDQALLEAVRGVAAYLREPPAVSDAARETASTAGPAPNQEDDEAAKTIALAQAALDRAAALAGAVGKESP
jgi:hypothetical protein